MKPHLTVFQLPPVIAVTPVTNIPCMWCWSASHFLTHLLLASSKQTWKMCKLFKHYSSRIFKLSLHSFFFSRNCAKTNTYLVKFWITKYQKQWKQRANTKICLLIVLGQTVVANSSSRILALSSHFVRRPSSTGVTSSFSPLYNVLDHTTHIFSESSWSKDIKTDITKCLIHKYTNTNSRFPVHYFPNKVTVVLQTFPYAPRAQTSQVKMAIMILYQCRWQCRRTWCRWARFRLHMTPSPSDSWSAPDPKMSSSLGSGGKFVQIAVLVKVSHKEMFSFRHCPNQGGVGGGGSRCPNFLTLGLISSSTNP